MSGPFIFDSIEDNYNRAQSTPQKTTIRGYWKSVFERRLDYLYHGLSRRFERTRMGILDALSKLDDDDIATDLESQFESVTDEIYKRLGDRSVIPIFESFVFETDIRAEREATEIEISEWKSKCEDLLKELDLIGNAMRILVSRQNFLAMKNLIDNID